GFPAVLVNTFCVPNIAGGLATGCQVLEGNRFGRLSRPKGTAFVGQERTTRLLVMVMESGGGVVTVTWNIRVVEFCPPLAVPPSSWTVTVTVALPMVSGAGLSIKLPKTLGLE